MRVLGLVTLLLAGCHAQTHTPSVQGLEGLTAPLLTSPLMRIGLQGSVDGTPALVEIDVTSPMTFVASGCRDGSFDGLGAAEFVPVHGAPHRVELVRSPELRVEGRRVALAAVALFGEQQCSLVLGSDALTKLAFTTDPATRRIHFEKSRTLAEWQQLKPQGVDRQVIQLPPEPRFNWPLVPVRLRQGSQTTAGTFVLATVGAFSTVLEPPMRSAGFDVLQLPVSGTQEKRAGAVMIEGLELTPGEPIAVEALQLAHGQSAPTHALTGELGVDVWGQFVSTIDLTAGVLVLQQPHVDVAEKTCANAVGAMSQEACFSFEARQVTGGVLTTVSVHRPVNEGLRLWLELEGVERAQCRVAISVPPQSRPFSTQHLLPWSRLAKSQPECAALLKKATGARFGLIEEGAATECPGLCALVSETRSGRISCECQPGPAGFSAEQLSVMKASKRAVTPEQLLQEPADPD